MEELGEYSYCYQRNGDLRDDLDRTAGAPRPRPHRAQLGRRAASRPPSGAARCAMTRPRARPLALVAARRAAGARRRRDRARRRSGWTAPSSARACARPTGGGKFVAIPGFPGEKIDRRLLDDIAWLEALQDLHHRRLLDGRRPLGQRRAPARPGARHRPQPGRGRHLERHRPPRRLGRAASRTSPARPFRWVGYDGDANHGRGHHLHLSWSHSTAKPGDPGEAGQHAALPGRATSAADRRGARGRSAHRRHRGPQRRRLAEAASRRRWSRPTASASAIRAP